MLEFAVARIGKRVPVLAGTGLPATKKTIAQTQRARDAGVDIALVVAPAYVRPTQEGMYRHFSEIADQGGLPVVLYNVPSRTACDLLPETVARLTRHGNIIGIKEARSERERMQALLAYSSDRFAVLSGDDPTAMRAMLDGAKGVISVAANVAPAAFAAMCERAIACDVDGAGKVDDSLQPLYEFLGVEPNPIPAKWLLSALGLGTAEMRLPLVPLSAQHQARGREILDSPRINRGHPRGQLDYAATTTGQTNVRRDIKALTIVLAASLLASCGWFDRHFHHENDEYKTSAQQRPLEIPPDLDKPNTSGALTIPDANATTTAPLATSDASAPPAAAPLAASPVTEAPVTTASSSSSAAPALLSGDALHISDTVDSVWNRIGLAMEHSGAATILARDEAGRTYDVQTTEQVTQKPGWFKKAITLGMAKGTTTAQARLRLRVTAEGDGSKVSVEGATDDASKQSAQALLSTIKQRLS